MFCDIYPIVKNRRCMRYHEIYHPLFGHFLYKLSIQWFVDRPYSLSTTGRLESTRHRTSTHLLLGGGS
jgi:hypothetical protein